VPIESDQSRDQFRFATSFVSFVRAAAAEKSLGRFFFFLLLLLLLLLHLILSLQVDRPPAASLAVLGTKGWRC
jgi:hypothetical protein